LFFKVYLFLVLPKCHFDISNIFIGQPQEAGRIRRSCTDAAPKIPGMIVLKYRKERALNITSLAEGWVPAARLG
jgi:hypothetical protein